MSNPRRSGFASGTRLVDEGGTNALAIRLLYGKSRCVRVKGLQRQSAVLHTDGGVEETTTTSWVEGLLVAAGHGGVVRRRYEKPCSLPSTLGTFPRGPLVPCLARRVLGSCSCFAFFKEPQEQKKKYGLVYWGNIAGLLGRFGWFVGQGAACFFLRLTY